MKPAHCGQVCCLSGGRAVAVRFYEEGGVVWEFKVSKFFEDYFGSWDDGASLDLRKTGQDSGFLG